MRATVFADVPQLVLGPLAGRPDADWHRAPPGKWSPAQIVQHLAIGIDGSGRTFESRRAHAPMCRRPRRSEEHTSELQSPSNLVCRLLLEKKKKLIYRLHTSQADRQGHCR